MICEGLDEGVLFQQEEAKMPKLPIFLSSCDFDEINRGFNRAASRHFSAHPPLLGHITAIAYKLQALPKGEIHKANNRNDQECIHQLALPRDNRAE